MGHAEQLRLALPGAREWAARNMPGFGEALQKEISSVLARTEE